MLRLHVWLTPTYNVARANCIKLRRDSADRHAPPRRNALPPPSSTSAIQTAFRQITYHTSRTWSQTVCSCMLHCRAFRLTS